jgi:hypothetical protein
MIWKPISTLDASKMKHHTQCLFLCKGGKYVELLYLYKWDKSTLQEHDLWAIKEGKRQLSDFLPRYDWDDINGDSGDLKDFTHWMPVSNFKKKK